MRISLQTKNLLAHRVSNKTVVSLSVLLFNTITGEEVFILSVDMFLLGVVYVKENNIFHIDSDNLLFF